MLNSEWFLDLLSLDKLPSEGNKTYVHEKEFILIDEILRSIELHSNTQQQTSDTFGFKWHKRDTFESEASLKMMHEWSRERYGDANVWVSRFTKPIVLDAGCGASYTGLEYFKDVLNDIYYLGADISSAVDVAKGRMLSAGSNCAFIQSDITNLPLKSKTLDIIFSEGVLHHTDSTENAIKSLAPLLKTNGLFMFYVYKRKGPIREYTDDYIREKLQHMSSDEAWKAMEPLSKLGKALGEINMEINIEEDIDLLEIPKGKINLQRLFYWHIFKAFYRSDYSLDEMNHINFDWYAPANAYRQTPSEVRKWCEESSLKIESEDVQDSGITIVARKIN